MKANIKTTGTYRLVKLRAFYFSLCNATANSKQKRNNPQAKQNHCNIYLCSPGMTWITYTDLFSAEETYLLFLSVKICYNLLIIMSIISQRRCFISCCIAVTAVFYNATKEMQKMLLNFINKWSTKRLCCLTIKLHDNRFYVILHTCKKLCQVNKC